ncbi:MAG: hypothetical protein NC127_05425 [Muribaculum sp.]|nr:hypothetical protein [Muribaculum sp.]
MLTHKILIWIWCLMGLFILSLVQSVAQVIPQEVSRYYFAVVYGLTLLFLIKLFSGRFNVKSSDFVNLMSAKAPFVRLNVIRRILPWTAVLVVSLVVVTSDNNFNYLSAENIAGLDTIFLCANLLFSIMLFRGAFTVAE